MERQVLNAALAGLLHDVGKFAQRAEVGSSRIWDGEAEREYKYDHALYSGDFAERYLPDPFRPLSPLAYHHAPKADLDRLVQLADHLSANEREIDRARNPQQLLSIFCRVDVEENGKGVRAAQNRHHALIPLLLNSAALFPADTAEHGDVADLYKALWDGEERRVPWPGFVKEAERLKTAHGDKDQADIEAYLESMLLLLQRYTWCIPSAYYRSVPDISLYDHSRTTAAIAACLTAHSAEQIQRWLADQDPGTPPVALLVGGDISGIQNFIYTITSKGAASALRGRSLYLQLLTEAVARSVLRRLELPLTNLLFAGGGHFYLLARHSDGKALDEIRREVSRLLLAHHRGDLYLALAWGELATKDFKGKPLSWKWNDLSAALRQAKLRRFSELAGDGLYQAVFEPRYDRGNEEAECQVCGWEHPGTKRRNETRICPQCESYEELGRDLRRARYLRLSMLEQPRAALSAGSPPGTAEDVLACFGIRARLYATPGELQQDAAALDGAHRSVVYALRDDALADLRPDARTAVGRRFFVNVTPVIDHPGELKDLQDAGIEDLPGDISSGAVKPFTALEHHSKGLKRLGVLRMDVDDMGRIINEGLGDQTTFSRIATLSFMVNLFFEGWAAELARKHNRQDDERYDLEKGKYDRVYSIYSGGDDLFFVGAWDAIAELALEVRNDLTRFVAEHPGIHASAGIVLVSGKYPLYQAAEDAQEALEAAKDRPRKNAINFLGQTLAWDKFAQAHDQKETFVKLVEDEDKGVPRGLLQRLTRLYLRYLHKENERKAWGEDKNKTGEEQVYWGPWHWHTAYQLTRLKVNGEAKKKLAHLRDQLSGEKFQAIKWIGLAARWADFLTR